VITSPLLVRIFSAEGRLLGHADLPFGVSAMGIARKGAAR
jgi:hypothetical protein